MGAKKNVDMSATTDEVKIVEAETPAEAEKTSKKPAPQRSRSKKYRAHRAKLDKTKKYKVVNAVELVKDLSYSKFDGTVTAALVVREVGQVGSVTLPHSTGKSVKAVIVDDKVLAQIEAGEVAGIDVLIAEPQYMPKLAKFGKVLGPKGLMPNPKSGTLTPNPKAKKKELEAGTTVLKTNKKEPVLHVSVGKVSMDTDKLAENIEALISAVGPKLVKLTLSASMSPGVRVEI